MRHPIALAASLFVLSSLAASNARAEPPETEIGDALSATIDRYDTQPSSGSGSLWVSLAATALRRSDGGTNNFGAVLLVGVPLDRFARSRTPRPLGASLASPAPVAFESKAKTSKKALPAPPPALTEASEVVAEPIEPLPIPIVVSVDDARAAVRAALRNARLLSPDDRLDALASRARSSALLPELRLRATRLVDEAQNLAPTEYDAARTTATDGTSLWLEARATWKLDRVVFADEEVAIERMRAERAAAQAKLTSRVLELLFAWQRAIALEADTTRTLEQHRADTLDVVGYEAELDVLTDGWFWRWRSGL